MKTKTAISILSALTLILMLPGCGENDTSSTFTDPVITTKAVTTAAPTEATTNNPELVLSENVKVGDIAFLVSKEWSKKDDYMWIASDHSSIVTKEPDDIDEDELTEADKEKLEAIFEDAEIAESVINTKIKGLKTVQITAKEDDAVYIYYGTIYNRKMYGFVVADSVKGKKTIIGKAFDDVIKSICFPKNTEKVTESPTEKETEPPTEKVSREFENALEQAKDYNKVLHMSKQGIFDQLTSEYGGKFSKDAAQYAVDNLKADYEENALKTAEDYNETLHMSKQDLYDQLISEYGAKFTEDEAEYAIDHLDADYKENALKSALDYQDTLHMSDADLYDQLISEYGAKFTEDEAQYAIDHLE